MDSRLIDSLVEAVAATIIDHADELTGLDQAIGDGDHGINMRRGFESIRAERTAIAAKPLPEALKQVGTLLVMRVGGASGPLYGTLVLTLGKELGPTPTRADLARAFAAAISAVKARGKSEVGQKTMLDVLVPVSDVVGAAGPDEIAAAAAKAAEATIPMKAVRGRASFLGDRSIGHMDPGARSSSLMIAAICSVLGARP